MVWIWVALLRDSWNIYLGTAEHALLYVKGKGVFFLREPSVVAFTNCDTKQIVAVG